MAGSSTAEVTPSWPTAAAACGGYPSPSAVGNLLSAPSGASGRPSAASCGGYGNAVRLVSSMPSPSLRPPWLPGTLPRGVAAAPGGSPAVPGVVVAQSASAASAPPAAWSAAAVTSRLRPGSAPAPSFVAIGQPGAWGSSPPRSCIVPGAPARSARVGCSFDDAGGAPAPLVRRAARHVTFGMRYSRDADSQTESVGQRISDAELAKQRDQRAQYEREVEMLRRESNEWGENELPQDAEERPRGRSRSCSGLEESDVLCSNALEDLEERPKGRSRSCSGLDESDFPLTNTEPFDDDGVSGSSEDESDDRAPAGRQRTRF
eukprot:TRINITY_DN25566_c0_g1_i4.p1 TRINITY_DN25566_c0_g1~~TRINITY_DN25566_c0_g1_i4.p1  ORF type:complete len:319 (-),score=53.09 TRINITY_DN25566_c0_g1_i4:11-967(-)